MGAQGLCPLRSGLPPFRQCRRPHLPQASARVGLDGMIVKALGTGNGAFIKSRTSLEETALHWNRDFCRSSCLVVNCNALIHSRRDGCRGPQASERSGGFHIKWRSKLSAEQ